VLFNSYPFLFVFFPAALLVHGLAERLGERARIAAVLAVSLVFYGAWDARFLALLGTSILVNYGIGSLLETATDQGNATKADRLLFAGVGFNLVVLGYFKYAHFLVVNLNAATGTDFVLGAIILPLGISFFTFEQIGYLIDLRRGACYRADLLRFALFVSFFPRLVAGPILRYGEILPQLAAGRPRARDGEDLAVGLTIFAIGLCKKSLFADSIAPCANPVFAAAAAGKPLDMFAAWGGALAYALQLYFDFSGYSDMAIGAARCFHIRFPANFNSPYKAVNIIEFWRRWHMTLSRFLRDYLYIPLGGNRRGPVRRYANLMITMLLGGLWHGANWTFIAWGGLHGLYLMINHGSQALTNRYRPLARLSGGHLARFTAWLVTSIAVVVAWVFFRSPSFAAALVMLRGMAGQFGAVLPQGLASPLSDASWLIRIIGIRFGEGSGTDFVWTWLMVVGLGFVAIAMPNTQQVLASYNPVLDMRGYRPLWSRLTWRPSLAWAVAGGSAAFLGIISIIRVSEFLYWQF